MNLSLPKPLLHSEHAPDEFAATAVIFNSIPSDLGSPLQRQFDGETPRQASGFGEGGDLGIVDIALIEVFPPDLPTALAQMPRHHSLPVLSQRIHRHNAASVHPMSIDAKIYLTGPSHGKIVMILATLTAQLRSVMMHAESQLQSLQLTPEPA
jgi:hypothetical protein